MAERKPVLLVDVDGVLNCFGNLGEYLIDFDHEFDWSFGEVDPFAAQARTYAIKVPAGTAERLAVLAEHFDMHWGTMWMEDAHPCFGERLGLGDSWPVCQFGTGVALRFQGEGRTWKLPYVDAYLHGLGDPPAAWLDDDLHGDAATWAEQRPAPTMLVRPSCQTGLTDDHVARLVEFAGVCLP